MKKSSGNISQDPSFNSVSLRRLRASGSNNIEIYSNVEIKQPNSLTVSQLKFIQETNGNGNGNGIETRNLKSNNKTSFIIDIDEMHPNTLVIRKLENELVVDTGVLYDTQFNKPDGGAVLYVSPTFELPQEYVDASAYLLENPSKILVVHLTQSSQFILPIYKDTGEDDFKQIRISNISFFPLTLFHNGTQIVEMFHERISVVWCQKGGTYTWNYIP